VKSLTTVWLIRSAWCVLFTSIWISGVVFGQTIHDSEAPHIQILKLHSKKQVRLPRNFDPSVMPATGGFADPARAASSGNSASAPGGTPFEATPYVTFPATPNRLPVVYVYSIKLRNVGAKTIVGVAWDYIFFDRDRNDEFAKHSFLSYGRVLPEQSRYYHMQLSTPAVKVVSATQASAKRRSKTLERAVIQCVLYEDDTVWQNAPTREGICESLKTGKTLMRPRRS